MISRPTSMDVASAMARLDRFNRQPVVVKAARKITVGDNLARALGGGGPGTWASNHRLEVEQYAGWHYVAINAILRGFQQAEPYAYDLDELKRLRREAATQEFRPKKADQPMGDGQQFGLPSGDKPVDENGPPKKNNMPSQFKSIVNMTQARGTPLEDEHPLVILLTTPNPYQAASTFRAEIALQLRLTGRCLVWNVPNSLNIPVERYVIPTAVCQPVAPSREFPRGGWRLQIESGRYGPDGFFLTGPLGQMLGYVISAEQVQEYREIHPLHKDDAQSPVAAGALWTDSAKMIDKSRHAHMMNGPSPSVVVAMSDEWNQDAEDLVRAQTRFNELYCGPDNHGKAIFTTAGEVTELDTTPNDMAYDRGFEQMRDAIMALHGVPPLAAGVQQATGTDSLYAPLIQFGMLTLQPMLDLVAEEDSRVLGKYWNAMIEYRAKQINDPAQKEAELATDIGAKSLTVDELRVERGRKPWGGDEGAAIAGESAQPQPSPFGAPPGAESDNPFDKIKGKQPDFLDSGKGKPGQPGAQGPSKRPFGGGGFGGVRKSLYEYLRGVDVSNGNGSH